jgi:hypothetical protein
MMINDDQDRPKEDPLSSTTVTYRIRRIPKARYGKLELRNRFPVAKLTVYVSSINA